MQSVRNITLSSQDADLCTSLFGLQDENIAWIEETCRVRIGFRDNQLTVQGEETDVENAVITLMKLMDMLRHDQSLDRTRIRYTVSMVRNGKADQLDAMLENVVAMTHRGKPIRAKTLGQQAYVQSIRDHDITFAVGPAGTGKTYLAVAMGVMALKNREVERIVLTRPAVEAGEKLGFLPGDLSQKVDPYLRPLYDALFDFFGMDAYQKMLERGTVEVAPLAYMRGRTLSNAFVILDEAQNTTSEQMKMFLTRLGFHSRMVVTGDDTQTDLPYGHVSGLTEATDILKFVPEIGIIRLTSLDVVRHELVQKIVNAYSGHQKRKEGK